MNPRIAADLRRQAGPFGAALVVSLLLHAAFVASLPGVAPRRKAPSRDVVVVELRDSALAPGATAEPEAVPPPDPASETREEPPAPGPEKPPAEAAGSAAPRGAEEAAPREPQAVPAAASPPPPVPAAPAQGAPAKRVAPSPPPVLAARPPPQLLRNRAPDRRDLFPRAAELAAYGTPKGLPDPGAPGAREAVVGLGEQDSRYRGYLNQVYASIYKEWLPSSALVVAGPSRTSVVRFSLTPLGLLGDVQIVQSSGNPNRDAEAVEAVRRARIPPFPTHWTIEKLHLVADFNLSVQQ